MAALETTDEEEEAADEAALAADEAAEVTDAAGDSAVAEVGDEVCVAGAEPEPVVMRTALVAPAATAPPQVPATTALES